MTISTVRFANLPPHVSVNHLNDQCVNPLRLLPELRED